MSTNTFTFMEFTTGSLPLWQVDHTGSADTTSATITYPPQTPSASGELYIGYASVTGTVSAGATSGYTYYTDAVGNQVIYNPTVSASTSPTGSLSPSGPQSTLAIVFLALQTSAIVAPGTANATATAGGPVINATPAVPVTVGASSGVITYYAYDAQTNTLLAELPLTSVTWSQRLNAAGSFSATLNTADPRVQSAGWQNASRTGRTVLVIDVDGGIQWVGSSGPASSMGRSAPLPLAGTNCGTTSPTAFRPRTTRSHPVADSTGTPTQRPLTRSPPRS